MHSIFGRYNLENGPEALNVVDLSVTHFQFPDIRPSAIVYVAGQYGDLVPLEPYPTSIAKGSRLLFELLRVPLLLS